MSPAQDFPLWIKHAMRTVATIGLLFVAWTAWQVVEAKRTLHELAARQLHFTSGTYGGAIGIWFAFEDTVPEDVIFSGDLSVLADDGNRYIWRPVVMTGTEVNDPDIRHWAQPPTLLAPFVNVIQVRLTAHLQGYSQPLPPLTLSFDSKETSMTATEVETCYLSKFPAPSNPNAIVPTWTGAFGQDGLPPPPNFTTDADAYAWIAANWTSPSPCK